MLGDHRIATLLAYRLLGVGCRLTRDHGRPGPLATAAAAAGARAVVGANAAGLAAAGPARSRSCWSPTCRTRRHRWAGRPAAVHRAARVADGAAELAVLGRGGRCGAGRAAATAARWPGCWAAPRPASWTSSAPGSSVCWTAAAAAVVTPILAEAELALLTDR